MKKQPVSSQYINDQRRAYSLYVLQMRAMPAASDGMKAALRRVMWTARDGKKHKSATLAGATMPIHPHATPEGPVDTLAAHYGNNIPLLTGDSAFGTLITPKEFSASRYTAVTASAFANDAFYTDIEIIPMRENYDGTLEEPEHFLPLVPIALLNPSSGIAIGFASTILPRALDDLIIAQISVLKGAKTVESPTPTFYPIEARAHDTKEVNGRTAYYFNGKITQKDASTAVITALPYSQTHDGVISKLDALIEAGTLLDYEDSSKDFISITLKFKRGYLKTITEEELLLMTGLTVREVENLNVLNFEGKAVITYEPGDLIRDFTEWRLKWYVTRYERLRDLLKIDIQRYLDIQTAIKSNVSAAAKKTKSRAELREFLETIGVVYTDYIADLPIYRFTVEEYEKNEQRIKDANVQLEKYLSLLGSDSERKKVYITELQEVLTKFNKGHYK